MRKDLTNNRGVSLIELVVTLVILSILASVIVPSAQMTIRRSKEIELRANLRTIRDAIDKYKKDYDSLLLQKKIQEVQNKTGYPETLETLVDGDDFNGALTYKHKYLRRIPRDPFHQDKEATKGEDIWNLRGYKDDKDSTNWNKEDVYDVSSKSDETAIDGSKYKDW